jgi:hypothetical protein
VPQKYSISGENNANDKFFPELLVFCRRGIWIFDKMAGGMNDAKVCDLPSQYINTI